MLLRMTCKTSIQITQQASGVADINCSSYFYAFKCFRYNLFAFYLVYFIFCSAIFHFIEPFLDLIFIYFFVFLHMSSYSLSGVPAQLVYYFVTTSLTLHWRIYFTYIIYFLKSQLIQLRDYNEFRNSFLIYDIVLLITWLNCLFSII